MAVVIGAGIAAIDFVMSVDALSSEPRKYRARDAAIVGGGCAATGMVAVARLGGTAHLAARLGTDEIGDLIVAGLEREGVDTGLVKRLEGRRSSFSTVLVDADGERQIVNYRDLDLETGAAWLEEAPLPGFDAAMGDTRWPEGSAAILKAARARSVPAVIDAEAPVMVAADALHAATHAAFSADGLREYTGETDLPAALKTAAARLDAWICVTDGANGVHWLDGGTVRHVPAFPVVAVDTLGAGDVWHGAFALALGEGMDEAQAIRFSNAVAGLKTTRFGGREGAPVRAEVDRFLQEHA